MKRFTILKPLLLLCALIVGVGSSWAAADVTYDFTGSDWTVNNGTLSNGTVSFTGEGEANFKMNGGYFFMGKKGAYLNFPTYSEPVEKIVVTGKSGASGSVEQNIYVGDVEVSTKTTGATGANTYEIASAYQTKGTQYTLKVVSNHNTQITKIEVFFVDESKQNVTLSFPENSYSADINDGFTAPTLTNENNVTVTYSSSKPAVATVNETTGAITLIAVGTTTITATFAGNDSYNSASAEYTLVVSDRNANDGSKDRPYTVAEARAAIDAGTGVTGVYATGIVSEIVTAYNSQYGNISYNISTDGLSTSDQLQAYRGKGIGGNNFTSEDDIQVGDIVVIYGNLKKYNSTYEFDQNNELVSLNRPAAKETPTLTLLVDEDYVFEMDATTEEAIADFFETNSDGEATFSSSDETIANVVEGKLQAYKAGDATITINIAATDTYKAISGSFAVKVTVKDAVKPEGAGIGCYFAKVTSTDDIVDGEYLIVYETGNVAFNGGLESLDDAGNTISVTISNSQIAATDATLAATFTIDVANGTLQSNSGYYIGVSGNSNGLKQDEASAKYTNSFEIDDNGDAIISAVFDESTMSLRYNKASNQTRFRYYKNSGQEAIQLYRLFNETTFDIEIGSAGYKTLVSAVDATLPEGVEAYIVTEANEVAKLSKVDAVKANTPYILKGDADTYTLTVSNDEVSTPTGNMLQISTEATGNGVYVLANGDNGPGFYKWAGGSLGAGRVYLPAPAGARDFIAFTFGEATGVEAVHSSQFTVHSCYDLQGRRVAQPTKGLYIVNGRKYVVK